MLSRRQVNGLLGVIVLECRRVEKGVEATVARSDGGFLSTAPVAGLVAFGSTEEVGVVPTGMWATAIVGIGRERLHRTQCYECNRQQCSHVCGSDGRKVGYGCVAGMPTFSQTCFYTHGMVVDQDTIPMASCLPPRHPCAPFGVITDIKCKEENIPCMMYD